MNVFRRMGEIISSNVNSALDKMEDPEKMIDLAITKLEDAIEEMKATIAEKSAEEKRISALLSDRKEARDRWQERAKLASDKGEDEMAKEAIEERLRLDEIIRRDEESISALSSLLSSLRESKTEAEEKLASMRVKSAELKLRARSAKEKIKVNRIKAKDENDAFERRIAEIKAKIDRWECQADESYVPPKKEEHRMSFEEMERNAQIEQELEKLKAEKKDA